MMLIAFPALVALLGLVFYAFSTNPKAQEAGRLAFACGLLAVCFRLANTVVP